MVVPRILLVSAKPFPLLAALAVLHLAVDPGQHVAGQREAELLGRHGAVPQGGGHLLVDLQDGRAEGSSALRPRTPFRTPIWESSSRMLGAPAPEAA